nr:odorant binding protein 27 [Pagiophloeus tsushimanus]
MICVVILGIFLFLPNILCLSEEMQELANQLHATCIEETGAVEDAVANARAGDFSEAESFKCYIKCLLDQMAIIDDDGIIDVEAMIAVLPEEMQEKTAPIVRKCDTQKGANACESAWLTHKCYYREGPEQYFLI